MNDSDYSSIRAGRVRITSYYSRQKFPGAEAGQVKYTQEKMKGRKLD